MKNHLLAFDKDIQFNDWNEFRLTDYVNYLRNEKKMRNSTINNQLDFLRWFLRWGIERGYSENRAFEVFKAKLKTTQKKVIFLTWEELNRLREDPIPETKKYLERVR
ncbi:Tyrosine recombinase XerC, partial [termite gut metagenome]